MSWLDRLLVLIVSGIGLSIVLAAVSAEVLAALVVTVCAISLRVVWWWTGRL